MIRLGLKMMWRDKKSSLFYLLAMFIGILVTFTFTTIATDRTVTNTLSELISGANSRVPMNEYLALIVVSFCCILVFYVNNYFILSKQDEIAGLLTYGATTYKVVIYFLTQTAFLFFIASIPAFILGYVSLDFIYQWIDSILGTSNHTLTFQSFAFTIILCMTIYMYLILYIVLHVSKLEVKDILYGERKSENTKPNKFLLMIQGLLKGEDEKGNKVNRNPFDFEMADSLKDKNLVYRPDQGPQFEEFMKLNEAEKAAREKKPKEKKVSLGSSIKIYSALFIAGVVLIPFMKSDNSMMLAFILAFVGIYGLVRRGILALIKYLKEKNMYTDRFSMVYLSNLKNTINRSKIIMILLILSVSVVFFLCLKYRNNVHEMVICVIGYLVTVILLSVCIMFFELIESKQRALVYSNMWKVGYTRKELVTIMRKEMILYYASFFVLPTILCAALSLRFILIDTTYISMCIGLILYYLAVLVVTGCIAYVIYRQTILSAIVEER
ncbi:MAG: ABC transporter permease [Firmicutes bacterium]|nr:ABC transporter permease [Bacillota bacterium]